MNLPSLFAFTTLTMIAFAANSVFGRIALGSEGAALIDPAGYTAVRLISGAAMLWFLVLLQNRSKKQASATEDGTWISAAALFAYAAFFSFAYLKLETGMGALILFACVQLTMIGWGMVRGNRLSLWEWLGVFGAMAGFVYLVSPGVQAPDVWGTVLMSIGGIAWGVYSIRGKGLPRPLFATAGNFIFASVMGAALSILAFSDLSFTLLGILLAVASGAITSALGYALWYRTLTHLSQTTAAVVQLTVPVIAAFGGILFLAEPFTLRFVLGSVAILGGVALVILAGARKTARNAA